MLEDYDEEDMWFFMLIFSDTWSHENALAKPDRKLEEKSTMDRNEYYSEIYKVVKKNIDKLDCYHLLEGGAPNDEFDIEIKDICEQITPDSSAEEIADIIVAVFKRWFGIEYTKDSLMMMSKKIASASYFSANRSK